MKTWTTKLGGAEFKLLRLQETGGAGVLDNPQSIVDYLRPQLAASLRYTPDTENLFVIHLNSRRRPIGWEIVSHGTLDTLLVHAREVFRSAIVMNAAAIVMGHNHPSGDPTPSEADIKVTRDLIRAGQLLKIELLDHVILGQPPQSGGTKDWASLRELGYFYL